MENELPQILDGINEPVTVEELEDVVRRSGQRRRASVIAGAAVLLAFGAAGGALIRGPVHSNPSGYAAKRPDPPPPKPASDTISGAGFPGWMGPNLTPLFKRDANGVAIRAYTSTADKQGFPESVNPACKFPTSFIQAELSNTAAVTMTGSPQLAGDTFALLGSGEFGTQEGETSSWAIARTGGGIATIRLRLGTFTDSMAPQGGFAILAVAGGPGEAVVEGLSADGKVVSALKFTDTLNPAPDPSCFPPPCDIVPEWPARPLPPPPVNASTPPMTAVSKTPAKKGTPATSSPTTGGLTTTSISIPSGTGENKAIMEKQLIDGSAVCGTIPADTPKGIDGSREVWATTVPGMPPPSTTPTSAAP